MVRQSEGEAQADGWFAIESGGRIRKRKVKNSGKWQKNPASLLTFAAWLVSQTPFAALSAPIPDHPSLVT